MAADGVVKPTSATVILLQKDLGQCEYCHEANHPYR